ncbi:hypothetical protein MAFF301560_04780 [Ralstonia solanacearum]|nr:probable proline-rich transmembrane protein [Ralstonia pseudosolanacearum GMI1000]BCL90830.1 hypothetical protein MAFF211479_05310 [Ralstonia solanacearum]BEU45131.1 hypothetical protein MAFF211519_04560 [Ralstonia pseudosolanacearum]BCL98761.1 hypothetical protein MAFF211491_32130 [Ralstonia solanacearum]BCM01091.1 hypothetical protein MAFF301560_04780 [Ralstonia solanacearum]
MLHSKILRGLGAQAFPADGRRAPSDSDRRIAASFLHHHPMIRTAAIVATVGLALTVTGLSGCGIRGPLYLPTVPPAPTAPTTPDPGIAGPNAVPQLPVPGTRAAPDAASAVPASR